MADIAGHATIAMAEKYSQQKRRAQITAGHLDAALGGECKTGTECAKQNICEPADDCLQQIELSGNSFGKEWWAHKDSNLGPAD